MSHKIFDNNFFAIHKSKLALKLNKPAYTEMCNLELSNSIMITLKTKMTTNQITLIVQCMKLKQETSVKILAVIKKCLSFVIIQLGQNTMIIQTN